MSIATPRTLMTAEELLARPDTGLERSELIAGELLIMSPAGSMHGIVTFNVSLILGNYVRKHRLGVLFTAETGFKIQTNPDTVRAPDVAFMTQARWRARPSFRGFFPGAPDLAVEVVSPDDSQGYLDDKIEEWLNAGTQSVWLVQPRQKTVLVYHADRTMRLFQEHEEFDGAPLFPDFRCPVAEFFEIP